MAQARFSTDSIEQTSGLVPRYLRQRRAAVRPADAAAAPRPVDLAALGALPSVDAITSDLRHRVRAVGAAPARPTLSLG
jgi:hypothetical protein